MWRAACLLMLLSGCLSLLGLDNVTPEEARIEGQVTSWDVSPDGTKLAVSVVRNGERTLQVRDVESLSLEWSYQVPGHDLHGVAFSPDGSQVAVGVTRYVESEYSCAEHISDIEIVSRGRRVSSFALEPFDFPQHLAWVDNEVWYTLDATGDCSVPPIFRWQGSGPLMALNASSGSTILMQQRVGWEFSVNHERRSWFNPLDGGVYELDESGVATLHETWRFQGERPCLDSNGLSFVRNTADKFEDDEWRLMRLDSPDGRPSESSAQISNYRHGCFESALGGVAFIERLSYLEATRLWLADLDSGAVQVLV